MGVSVGFPYTVQELENTICGREHAVSDIVYPFQIPAHDDVGIEINYDATRFSAVQAPGAHVWLCTDSVLDYQAGLHLVQRMISHAPESVHHTDRHCWKSLLTGHKVTARHMCSKIFKHEASLKW